MQNFRKTLAMNSILRMFSRTTTDETRATAPQLRDMSFITGKHIVITGAGVAGLSFALSIHKRWPKGSSLELPRITIVERDSKEKRLGREGYTLYIRSDGSRGGGVQVLDDLGLYEAVRDIAVLVSSNPNNEDDQQKGQSGGDKEKEGTLCFWDKNWSPMFKIDPTKSQNKSRRKLSAMRVRRNGLQQLFANKIEALPNVQIKWGTEVVGVERTTGADEGKLDVLLNDKSQIQCDFVIAADGSKSKTRKALRPSDGLDFRGLVAITGTARFGTREQIPEPFKQEWGMFQGWTGTSLFITPFDKTAITWSMTYRSAEPRQLPARPFSSAIANSTLDEARELGLYAGPRLRKLIDATDPGTLSIFNLFDRAPFSHDFDKHGRIIWIGDANHAVTQFAGNGANMAMMDSWDLAGELLNGKHSNLETAVKAWEGSMIPRTKDVLSGSHGAIDISHAVGWKAWFYWIAVKMSVMMGHNY